MSKLKKILEEIQQHSGKGVQSKLALARIGLKAGINITQIDESTPSNPELEERLIKASKEILNIDIRL